MYGLPSSDAVVSYVNAREPGKLRPMKHSVSSAESKRSFNSSIRSTDRAIGTCTWKINKPAQSSHNDIGMTISGQADAQQRVRSTKILPDSPADPHQESFSSSPNVHLGSPADQLGSNRKKRWKALHKHPSSPRTRQNKSSPIIHIGSTRLARSLVSSP
jgi:hypothetical protein